METINIHYAKTHFSKLLVRAHSGEEIIICKAGKPYAKLIPLEKPKERKPGLAKGSVTSCFFDPLPEEELRHWEQILALILLDTHIFLWWLFDDPQLPECIRKLLRNIDNQVYVSTASVWEITTKFRIGKLPKAASVAIDVPKWIVKAEFYPMAITPEHAQMAIAQEVSHRDPFDRMLAAQANCEKMPLASPDKHMSLFPIELIP